MKFNNGSLIESLKEWLDDDNKAIKIDSDLAYYNRGLAKYSLDDINGACSDVKKSVNLGWDDSQDFIGKVCN